MRPGVRDYRPVLRRVLAEARVAGMREAADELDRALAAAFTTSTEMLETDGLAIARFLAATRGRLPADARRRLEACRNETQVARRDWRGWLARLRRPRILA